MPLPCRCQGDAESWGDSRQWHPLWHHSSYTCHEEMSHWCYCWGCRKLLPSAAPYQHSFHHTENHTKNVLNHPHKKHKSCPVFCLLYFVFWVWHCCLYDKAMASRTRKIIQHKELNKPRKHLPLLLIHSFNSDLLFSQLCFCLTLQCAYST